MFNVAVSPFGKVGFAENFVADVLTSLVKVMSYVAYSVCFLVTPRFVLANSVADDNGDGDDDGEDMHAFEGVCNKSGWGTTLDSVISLLPLTWRMLQCLRRFYYSGDRWPHLFNAFKYFLSILVVLVTIYKTQVEGTKDEHFVLPYVTAIWFMFYFSSTFYSWWYVGQGPW